MNHQDPIRDRVETAHDTHSDMLWTVADSVTPTGRKEDPRITPVLTRVEILLCRPRRRLRDVQADGDSTTGQDGRDAAEGM